MGIDPGVPLRPRVHWDGRKWPDRLHWQFDMTRLGEDEHGIWLYMPADSEHQQRFGYPPQLVEAARRASDEVIDLVARQAPPFDETARGLADGGRPGAPCLTAHGPGGPRPRSGAHRRCRR